MLSSSVSGVLMHPDFSPVALAIGPLKIHWYGLMYLAAFVAAWMLARRRSQRSFSPVKAEEIDDLIFYGAMGVVLGGRVGYVFFYNFDKFLTDPLWLFKIWDGGMSFHGGLLGVIVAMFLLARKLKQTPGSVLDFVAPIVPIGLGLGRLGNFIGQELWGRPTDLPWAMLFPRDPEQLARHPSQLYQFFLEAVVLFSVVWWFSSKKRAPWAVSGVFLFTYGLLRFGVEFVREPDSHIATLMFGWMSRGQLLCLPMMVIGALMIWQEFRPRDAKAPVMSESLGADTKTPAARASKTNKTKKSKRRKKKRR